MFEKNLIMKFTTLSFIFFFQSVFSQNHKTLICNGAYSSVNGSYVVGKIFVISHLPEAKQQKHDSKKPFDIFVYPNPVTSELKINTNEKISTFSIYSVEGKFLFQGNVANNSIILSNLKKGYYTIILDNDRSKSFKILKN